MLANKALLLWPVLERPRLPLVVSNPLAKMPTAVSSLQHNPSKQWLL